LLLVLRKRIAVFICGGGYQDWLGACHVAGWQPIRDMTGLFDIVDHAHTALGVTQIQTLDLLGCGLGHIPVSLGQRAFSLGRVPKGHAMVEKIDLEERMHGWREGLLSDAEILAFLILAVSEVQQSMLRKETDTAKHNLPYGFFGKREG